MRTPPFPHVDAAVVTPEGRRHFHVTGQTARALLALVDAGPRGCTAQEVSSWALRFAAYCHVMIHENDLNIVTEREEHHGGWHGRHVLKDHVEILRVVGLDRKVAA